LGKQPPIGEDGAMIPADLLDPAALAAVVRPFGESRMLPSAAYTSEGVLGWERTQFFAGTWTCLGRRPAIGQRAYAVGNLGVLVTVSRDNAVRAFANVCRHRGHELLPIGTDAAKRAIVCPYHGWAYRLDGSLQAAPEMPADFDRTPWGLVELPAVDWHGWVFVNADGAAMPFADFIGELDDWVTPYAPERLHIAATHRYEVAANWKLIVENYHECYHCPMIHPELCTVTAPASGDNGTGPGAWVGGTMDLLPHAQTMSFDGSSHAPTLSGVNPRTVTYIGLFPHLLVSLHPDYVMTHRLVPLAPGRTFVECQWLFAAPAVDPAYAVEFWDRTNRQDWAAVESVQRGLASPHHRPGPLAPSESAIYDWVTMLARGYHDVRSIPRSPAYLRA
jgi:Rieske 2Fe-2S family protein